MLIEPSAIGVWVWNQYGKDIALSTLGALKKGWKRFKWPEAEQKYKNRLKEHYSTMRVLFKAETVPLNDLYVDLFVLEEPEAFRRYGTNLLESEFEDSIGFFSRGERSNAVRVVSQIDHLFVLGKPGAGKTTLLKHLTTLASEEKIDRVPIFISFNNWAVSQKELIDFIVEQFDICGFPHAKSFIEVLLGRGNAILLFDGLDEVSEENNLRNRLIYEVEKLITRYPVNKYIITCRNAANEYQFDGFTYVEIADFSDKQVNIFVNKWFGDNPQKAQDFMKGLVDSKHQNLRELSHNPLLLGMLCLVYEATSNFPVKRGEVYQDAIDALLKRWDKQRAIQRDKIPGFSPEIENHLLSFLAYDYFLENKIFFEQNDLQNKTSKVLNELLDGFVDSEIILNAIEVQHGLLAKRAHRIYTFSHLTFQEYFASRYIIDHLNTANESLIELFRHLYNSRWREVFLLTSSLLPSADQFFEIFKTRVRNPVKKDKEIAHAISWSNKLSLDLIKESSHLIERMVSIALVISIGRIISYLQTITEKRDQKIAIEFIEYLNLDETDIDESIIAEIIRTVVRNIPFTSKLAEKFKSLIKLSIKRSSEFDFNENIRQIGNRDLDISHIRIRDHLRAIDKELAVSVKEEMIDPLKDPERYGIATKYGFLGISFRITRDSIVNFLTAIIKVIEESDIPNPYATSIEWEEFSVKLYQKVIPDLEGDVPYLSEEQLDILEQFLKSNIFFLECLKLANVSNYKNIRDSVFSLEN